MAEYSAAKRNWLWALICLMGLALAAVVYLKVASHLRQANLGPPGAPLVAGIPATLPGWESRPLYLSATEEGVKSVRETLRYDEVFYREYSSPRGRLQVYAAYWAPGKMPPHLVASHTPDICWSIVGWTCTDKRKGVRVSWTGRPLWPAQARQFKSASGELEHVLFWHLVDGKVYDIGLDFNQTPNPVLYWRDVLRFQLGWQKAQFFIRLSSNQSFDSLQGDLGWEELLRALARLGLAEQGTEDMPAAGGAPKVR